MIKPEIARNEKERLSALKDLGILDTPAEKQYDEIVELATYIAGMPVAFISLVDKDRQWIKAKVGLDICETSRNVSFCGHTILEDKGFLEIEDTRLDERFKDNPFTVDENQPVVYYAGFVLNDSKGLALGTLCLVDHKPRKLTAQQIKALKTLAHQVELLFELHANNKAFKRSTKNLERHNDMLKSFAGAVSHDLKMPLSNIILTIDVLKHKYADNIDAQAIAYLNRLKQSSFGMSDYISNILKYYETENVSSEDYNEEPFGLKGFLEGIVDMLNIESDCEINLPEHNFDLICNRSGLEQIFINLLGNSLKYNDKRRTIISIDCEEGRKYYKFKVTDNGMGIPKDKQSKVFDLFSIASDRDRHGKKGHGIGLSIVWQLVHKLGGKIKLDSEVGKYTSFSFTIKKQKPKLKTEEA